MKILLVKVKPNARVSTLKKTGLYRWSAQLKSPPIDGKANKELVALIAGHWGCPKSAVSIKSGATGHIKLVKISGNWKMNRAGKSPGERQLVARL